MPRLEQADAAALAGLFRIDSLRLDIAATLVSHTGDLLPWLSFLVLLAWCGRRWGRGRQAAAATGMALVAVAASQVLKVLLAHPRAQAVLGGDVLGPEALPSGHTTAAMSVAVTAVLVAPADLRSWAVGLGALYAAAMGASVVVLAWHLPSDVFAAMLLATACGFGSLLVTARLPGWLDGPRRRAPAPVVVLAYLLVIAGVAAFIVAAIAGSERAGRAVAYAHANRSAVVAVCAICLLALVLLTALARVTTED